VARTPDKDQTLNARRDRSKAHGSRNRHVAKLNTPLEESKACPSSPSLTPEEHSVLDVFRNYLMTPGKMLCFSSAVFPSLRGSLDAMASKGLLVEEKPAGSYSLTPAGFNAMNKVHDRPPP
jgi:hypothetical protein